MSSSTFSALHVDGYVYASPSKSIARDDLSDGDDDTALMDAYNAAVERYRDCLLYTSPSPRDQRGSRMPSAA